jgi:hypothetical protein
MESKLLKKIIKNQRIIMKKQRKTDGWCNQIELRQNTLYRNIMRGNYNLMEIAVEEMKKVDLFYSGLIKKYRMKDLSASSEQCKRMIKSEIKYGEVSKHTQELKVNMKIIDGFFGADFSGVVEPGEENDPEKNMEDDLEKDVEDPEKNMGDEDGDFDVGFDLLGSCVIDHLDFFQMGLPELDFNSHVSFNMP